MTTRALTASFLALTLAGAAAPVMAQREPDQPAPRVQQVPRGPLSDSERAILDGQNA